MNRYAPFGILTAFLRPNINPIESPKHCSILSQFVTGIVTIASSTFEWLKESGSFIKGKLTFPNKIDRIWIRVGCYLYPEAEITEERIALRKTADLLKNATKNVLTVIPVSQKKLLEQNYRNYHVRCAEFLDTSGEGKYLSADDRNNIDEIFFYTENRLRNRVFFVTNDFALMDLALKSIEKIAGQAKRKGETYDNDRTNSEILVIKNNLETFANAIANALKFKKPHPSTLSRKDELEYDSYWRKCNIILCKQENNQCYRGLGWHLTEKETEYLRSIQRYIHEYLNNKVAKIENDLYLMEKNLEDIKKLAEQRQRLGIFPTD